MHSSRFAFDPEEATDSVQALLKRFGGGGDETVNDSASVLETAWAITTASSRGSCLTTGAFCAGA